MTQSWLATHKEPVFGFPGLVRFSWAGTARILAEHGVPVSWCAPVTGWSALLVMAVIVCRLEGVVCRRIVPFPWQAYAQVDGVLGCGALIS